MVSPLQSHDQYRFLFLAELCFLVSFSDPHMLSPVFRKVKRENVLDI
jgi:hypothetical protein